VRSGARAFGLVIAFLLASGMLATVALGESCAVTLRWNDTIYSDVLARFALPERGAPLDEVTIPDCTRGGRCAPPEESIAAFELTGVPAEVAVLVPEFYDELFVAAGTFPELADHPLHEAVFGRPSRPDYRQGCGEVFRLQGTVNLAGPLRVAVTASEIELDEDQQGAWLELDARSRIDGFDSNGIPTLEPGDEIVAQVRTCEGHGELAGPVVDLIEPAR
jgi:hypothetical protein